MRVLGIVGSPRRNGNTHSMVLKALEGAKAEGALTDILFLADMKIRECDGCHACWKGHSCSKNDDMLDIYQKIAAADAIVFGTPVYWFGPTALMKCLLDRFVYFNCPTNRIKVKGKKALLLVPFEDTDLGTAGPLVDMFQKSINYLEMELDRVILAPGLEKKGEVINDMVLMSSLHSAGRSLVVSSH